LWKSLQKTLAQKVVITRRNPMTEAIALRRPLKLGRPLRRRIAT
jgi:hypothetical protein